MRRTVLAMAVTLLVAWPARAQDPLPSWNDGASKKAIVDFVGHVTRSGAPDFVAPADRIAVFDNDGTLWSEQPTYFQFAFALDRVRALAPQHPEWKTTQPFKAVLDGDLKALAASGEKGLAELVLATHTGMTPLDEATARQWLVVNMKSDWKVIYPFQR